MYCFIHLLFVELNESTALRKLFAVKIKLYSLCHVQKKQQRRLFSPCLLD